ncbi:D-ribose pyranase [Streptomyces phaeolivaceus]|uniref:D-ribose pyranase n=1 Tax=Streptomyces phaeolivaceus TaxID=2653200 RepID=A0A5P8KE75_9ACTN|nr:RbsD/FucU domain-containing protein [Streptomyces phaeolivaceus]QFR01634.1 D-ribose pyranase [Streptomyces phaeolivaceus]
MTESPQEQPKARLLHPRLAAVLAGLRHGEMVCVSDAGSGSSEKSLVPLAPDVERIDLGIATDIPTCREVVGALHAAGDFEAAIVADVTPEANEPLMSYLVKTFGDDCVHVVDYLPTWYELRNRVKVFIQTGDYGLAASTILVAGYPSPNIPLEWLKSNEWYERLLDEGGKFVSDGETWHRVDDADTDG